MDGGEAKRLDPQRLTAWHSAYADRLKAFLHGLLRSEATVDEALQSTFAKALTHGGDVQSGAEKAWLFQVAFNEAMAVRRTQQVRNQSLEKLNRGTRTGSEPVEDFLRWEMVQQVREALVALPKEQYEVVTRRIYEDKTFQEIAGELQLPLGTVLTRMRLALKKLQQVLKAGE